MWPSLLGGIRTEDAVAEADGSSHRLSDASHRLNDSGIELISSASSSSASDSWLAQVPPSCCGHISIGLCCKPQLGWVTDHLQLPVRGCEMYCQFCDLIVH